MPIVRINTARVGPVAAALLLCIVVLGAVVATRVEAVAQPLRPLEPGDWIEPDEPIAPPELDGVDAGPIEVLPGVVLDREAGTVEFEGIVPIVADGDSPRTARGVSDVLLELLVTVRGGGRDHEALVMTTVRPSHVHAALLLLGLQAGEPGVWRDIGRSDGSIDVVGVAPTGDLVAVEFIVVDGDGRERVLSGSSWVRHAETGGQYPVWSWVFAGSRFVFRQGEERYDADFSGVLVGLAQFGVEVIASPETYHPDIAVQEPVWFAAADTPEFGTRVRVRIRSLKDEAEVYGPVLAGFVPGGAGALGPKR